jgi:hypothetical protein
MYVTMGLLKSAVHQKTPWVVFGSDFGRRSGPSHS